MITSFIPLDAMKLPQLSKHFCIMCDNDDELIFQPLVSVLCGNKLPFPTGQESVCCDSPWKMEFMFRLLMDRNMFLLRNDRMLLSMASSLTGSSHQHLTPQAILDEVIQSSIERRVHPENLLAELLQYQHSAEGISLSPDEIKWEHYIRPVVLQIRKELKSLFCTNGWDPDFIPSTREITFVFSILQENRDMTIDFFVDNYTHSGNDKNCLTVQCMLYSKPHSPFLLERVPHSDEIDRLLRVHRGDVDLVIEDVVIGTLKDPPESKQAPELEASSTQESNKSDVALKKVSRVYANV